MPLLAPMPPRDTHEEHRSATPLELFFDLTFVVAIAQAGNSLHHGLVDGDAGDALLSFPLVFFAIWWAWMNFTWFASAYDNDDVAYRLTVFVLMTGVLILAAGVPRAFDDQDFGVITLGYVVMRLAMVGLWLRAAAEHPEGRRLRAALRLRHCRAPDRLGAPARPARGRGSRRVLRAGRARALGAGVGRGGRAYERGTRGTSPSGTGCSRSSCSANLCSGRRSACRQRSTSTPTSRTSRRWSSAACSRCSRCGGSTSTCRRIVSSSGRERRLTPGAAVRFAWGYGHYFVFGAAAAMGAGLVVAVDQVNRPLRSDRRAGWVRVHGARCCVLAHGLAAARAVQSVDSVAQPWRSGCSLPNSSVEFHARAGASLRIRPGSAGCRAT